jgi:NADH-quinone oxidoreductase subunit M
MLHMTDSLNYISGSILNPAQPVYIAAQTARWWAFLFVFIGFAIKLPAVPLHTWLPDAHVEAPTPISVILAALLLKVGAYGLLRIAYPVFPDVAATLSWFVALIGVISIIYGAMNALASKDLKRLIAYSSVSHMGFVLLGIASVTTEGVSGAVYQMFSHGIISSMLFLIAGVLYDRTQDRIINNYSGLSAKMPAYFTVTLIAFFASLGLPGFLRVYSRNHDSAWRIPFLFIKRIDP